MTNEERAYRRVHSARFNIRVAARDLRPTEMWEDRAALERMLTTLDEILADATEAYGDLS